MKKNKLYQIGLSAVFMMFSLMQPANAAGEKEIEPSIDQEVTGAELSNPGVSGISIIIYNGNDRAIYNDRIPAGSTVEGSFDISVLQQGIYRVVKQLDDINFTRTFKVEENGVVLPQSYYSFTPRFKPEEKLLSLKYINSSQTQVRIEISDTWDTVFEDTYREPGRDLTLNYDLRSFPAGAYTMHLRTSQDEFSFRFEVK